MKTIPDLGSLSWFDGLFEREAVKPAVIKSDFPAVVFRRASLRVFQERLTLHNVKN